MKTREEIITSMCYTMRHDYGLVKNSSDPTPGNSNPFYDLVAGMFPEEREALWRQMAQLFDNDIAPYMDYKK